MRTMTFDLTGILFISWPPAIIFWKALWVCVHLYMVLVSPRSPSKSTEPKEWKKLVLTETDELNRTQKKNG